MHTHTGTNPLGSEKIGTLLIRFAVPSIISMLVGSLYNMVDQFFIGQKIGELGNAATNIAFPMSTACIAIALLLGIGGASAFNLSMGRKEFDKAPYYLGNSAILLFLFGVFFCLFTQIFLEPMLLFFGSSASILPYAEEYTRITSLGFPFLLLQIGGGHLIRADGRPRMTMLCNLSGAIINTILDALFVIYFNLGMAGAAYATIIGQFLSALLAIWCLSHCTSVKLRKKHLIPQGQYVKTAASLGMAPCSNQLAMMIVQILMNKSLKYYGSLSIYGEAIPIACSGIISKVNMIFMSFVIGLSQGLQPIVSFNYGAKQFQRVRYAYRKTLFYAGIIAMITFLLFQIFPREIISIFGKGSPAYYQFSIQYFRIFLFFTFLNFLQPISANFFTAIGKPKMGSFLSLTRQVIFLIPLLLIFPLFFQIDGIMYAGPVADGMAALVTFFMIRKEFAKTKYQS